MKKNSQKWQMTGNSRKGFHAGFVPTLRPEVKAEGHGFKAWRQVQTYLLGLSLSLNRLDQTSQQAQGSWLRLPALAFWVWHACTITSPNNLFPSPLHSLLNLQRLI